MRKYFKQKLGIRSIVILVLTFIALSTLTYTTKVRQTTDDSMFSLLVAQAIMQEGSIKLNRYGLTNHPALKTVNGNHYDLYPLGTPVLSIPAVYIMNRMGLDMSTVEGLTRGQIILAALLNPVIFVLLFLTGRYYVSDLASFVISLVSFLGSGLTSTLNTALWSHNYGLIMAVAVILMLVRYQRDSENAPNPYVLGSLLFLAFFTRPSFLILTIATLAYLMSRDMRLLTRTTATFAGFLAFFMIFSLIVYGSALPPYYTIGPDPGGFFPALYGLLLSPSRGLFIYSPFLIPVVGGAIFFFGSLKRNRLFLYSLGIAALNILAVALWALWHGDSSFGPRLLVDSLPAYVLMSFLLWRYLSENDTEKHRKIAMRTFMALGTLAIWINSYQGLYNEWTYMWNKYPPIGADANRTSFDWRHPQILATGESVKDKLLWFYDYTDRDAVIDHKGGKLIDFDLSTPRGHIERGRYKISSNQADLAMAHFDKAVSMSPPEPEAFYSRGSLLMQKGQNGKAIEDFTTAIELDPEDNSSIIKRGMAYDNTGQYELALWDFVNAISLAEPKDTGLLKDLYLRRGIDHFRTGYYDSAVSDLLAAIGFGNNAPAAYYYIAASYYADRRYYDAVKAYKDIISRYPKDEKARLLLLNSMRKNPDADTGAVLNDLKDFVISTPSDEHVRSISRHYIGMETLGEEEIIAMAEARQDPGELCDAYYLLAEQRLMHGFTAGARGLLKKGEDICPTDAPEYYLTKSLLRWLGR